MGSEMCIRDRYNALKNDPEIQKLIERVKSHKWIKIIEGEA